LVFLLFGGACLRNNKSTLLSVVLVIAFILAFIEYNHYSDKKEWTVLDVSGTYEEDLKPDLVNFSVTIEKRGENEKEVMDSVVKTSKVIAKTLTEEGVSEDEIETSQLQSGTNNWSTSEQLENDEFYIYVTMNVRTKAVDKIPAFFTEFASNKDIRFSGPFYEVEGIEKARSVIVGKATDNAREKAEAMASSLGVKIKDIKSIRTDLPVYGPLMKDGSFNSTSVSSTEASDVSLIPVFGKKVKLSSTVFVEYYID
jgi:uncharacterized protein YggE